MSSKGINKYLKITDTAIALVIVVVVILGGILVYKALTKDDRCNTPLLLDQKVVLLS